jgi:hypothetical protein
MKSDARAFAEGISALLGAHDSIRIVPATRAGLPPVCCFIFQDRPETGMMTAVTYGLSLSEHTDWGDQKPELIARVRSSDEEWGLALAGFAERLRGEHSFADGSILMGPSPLSSESEMGGFLLGDPPAAAGATLIELPTRTVRLRSAIPIYECEATLINDVGPKEFLQRTSADFRDVQREHIWERVKGEE